MLSLLIGTVGVAMILAVWRYCHGQLQDGVPRKFRCDFCHRTADLYLPLSGGRSVSDGPVMLGDITGVARACGHHASRATRLAGAGKYPVERTV